jgi:alkaline phosphatase D
MSAPTRCVETGKLINLERRQLFFASLVLGVFCSHRNPSKTNGMPDPDTSAEPSDGDAGIGDSGDSDSADTSDSAAPNGGLQAIDDPGPPDYPATISILSMNIRTADKKYADSDENELFLCLTDTHCYQFDVEGVDDYRLGETDVYIFENIDLARSEVDRVELRSDNGVDRWIPACVEVHFDGELVYCEDEFDIYMGDSDDETESWEDPKGLHIDCTTCFDEPLTHGPMIGATEPDTARIWVRTHATTPVALRMAEPGEDLDEGPIVAWSYPLPNDDFASVLTATGLSPDTTHPWRLEVDGEIMGDSQRELTTPPDEGTSGQWQVAFGSCSKNESQHLFEVVDAHDPDLFLFLGDNHYANSGDLHTLRWYYRWSRNRTSRAAMLQTTSTLAIWDDHDFTGDNTDGTESGKDNALQAFGEYWANPSMGTKEAAGIYFTHRMGDLEFFMTDDRYWRNLEDSVLGDAQTTWLLDALEASDATFKFVACGSQWTSEGSSDSWAAYDDARESFFQALSDRAIEGVVLLSGDVHRSELREITRDSGYELPELTSSPMANSTASCSSSDELQACFDDDNSFILLDIDTEADDPYLVATIYDSLGEDQASMIVRRSELQ